MNIFVLDRDPETAAILQCDSHVVKMILESAQMLCAAHHVLDSAVDFPAINPGYLYKPTHTNHPCSKWVRESVWNYVWLYQHFRALSDEYTYRFGKKHKSWITLGEKLNTVPKNIPTKEQTPFALAMPHSIKQMSDKGDCEKYRIFYNWKSGNFKMKWTKRVVPTWFQQRTE